MRASRGCPLKEEGTSLRVGAEAVAPRAAGPAPFYAPLATGGRSRSLLQQG